MVTRKIPILCNVSAPSRAAIKPFLAQNGMFRGSEKLLHPAKSTISQCKKHHFTTRYAPYCSTKWCLSDDERVLFAKYLNFQRLSVSPECPPPTTFLKCHYVVTRAAAATLCHLRRHYDICDVASPQHRSRHTRSSLRLRP